jgi:hypothetical protein
MSTNYGPSIATSGLVFSYDMANTKKSWKGAPITNVQWNSGSEITPWTVNGQNNDVSSTIGLTAPIPQAKTWEFIKTGTSNQWNGWENSYGGIWTGSSGDYWSISYWYKTVAPAGVTGFGIGSFFTSDWSRAYNTTVIDNVSSIIADGNWHYNYTVVRFNENYSNAIIADGPSWGYSTSAGVLYVNGLCWNKNSYPSPWAAGTRSNTQAILDLTGNNTLTTSSLTYNSDGTFSFNGTSDFISASTVTLPSGTSNSTMLVWCYPDSSGPTSQYTGLLSYGNRSSSDSRLLSLYTSGTTMYVSSAYWGNDYTPNNLSVTANAWNMVGMTTLGSGVANNTTLYCGNASGFNSVTGSSSSYATPLATQSKNLAIGCTDFGGRYMKGKIVAAMIYNRALSTAEMQQIFNAFRGRYGI